MALRLAAQDQTFAAGLAAKVNAMKKIADFLFRPRYLRAIPSLMVLTTAMAWGVAPDPDTDMTDAVQKRASVTLSLSHTAGSSPGSPGDKPLEPSEEA